MAAEAGAEAGFGGDASRMSWAPRADRRAAAAVEQQCWRSHAMGRRHVALAHAESVACLAARILWSEAVGRQVSHAPPGGRSQLMEPARIAGVLAPTGLVAVTA